MIVVAREFFVSSLRGFMESRGVAFAAEWSGKIKMMIQSIAVGALIFCLPEARVEGEIANWLWWTSTLLVWAALVSTIQSGVVYLLKGMKELEGSKI